MRGKLIVVEGTDCSGKETQTNNLLKYLEKYGSVKKYSFPNYNSPTGKIVGGPYLGKKNISLCWFNEGASNVPAKVASLYFAADRLYNITEIEKSLANGENVILDRYTYSNMAHQGGKLETEEERDELFNWISKLEFDFLGLPIPDIKIFLHLSNEGAKKLRAKRNEFEELDEHEKNEQHLINAEKTYIELAKKFDFFTIECMENDRIKTIEEISEEIYKYIDNEIIEK